MKKRFLGFFICNRQRRGPRPEVGYIGLQNYEHDAKEKDSHIYFKEISIAPLSTTN